MAFPGEQFPSVDPLAIQWSSDGAYLWRLVDSKVEKVPVQIIQRNSDGIMVEADIKAGDQVVTQGVQQLTAGATVRLLDDPNGGQQGEGKAKASDAQPVTDAKPADAKPAADGKAAGKKWQGKKTS